MPYEINHPEAVSDAWKDSSNREIEPLVVTEAVRVVIHKEVVLVGGRKGLVGAE